MRLLVCGSRRWRNLEVIERRLVILRPTLIIQGGQVSEDEAGRFGADWLARVAADNLGIPWVEEAADWEAAGPSGSAARRRAGPARNQRMLEVHNPTRWLAFHEDWQLGRGTADMVRRLCAAGIPGEAVILPGK